MLFLQKGLRGIVSNAGVMVMGECELLPPKLLRKAMDVNFFGAVEFIQKFLPLVRRSKGMYGQCTCRYIFIFFKAK